MARSLRFVLGFALMGACCSCVTVQESSAQAAPVEAYIVVDFHSRKILSAREAGTRRSVASLTKIATAMVVLDWAQASGADLGQLATVPPSAAAIGGPNQMGLRPGDRISLRDALYCAILGSDNWAAETVAHHVGADLVARGGLRESPVSEFVRQMNSLAENKGAEATRFTNPHGMDHQRPVPHSCAADIARLAIYAMGKSAFTFFCSQPEREVTVHTAAGVKKFVVKNTNKLLGVDRIDGVKTGLTTLAGPCLVVSADKPSLVAELPDGRTRVTPRRLVVVVLGARDRFGVARGLMAGGWERFDAWHAAGRVVRDPAELLAMPKE